MKKNIGICRKYRTNGSPAIVQINCEAAPGLMYASMEATHTRKIRTLGKKQIRATVKKTS